MGFHGSLPRVPAPPGTAPSRHSAAPRIGRAALACVLVLLGLGALAPAPLAAASSVTVSDAQDLKAAFARAGDGDRIVLAPGRYGHVVLSGRSFAPSLTLASADPADPAVLETLKLDKVGGMTLSGIAVRGTALPPTGAGWRILVAGSHDVMLDGIRVTGHIPTDADGSDPGAAKMVKTAPMVGYAHDIGLRVTDSRNITVEQSEFADLRIAVALTRNEQVRLSRLDIHGAREGIDMNDVRGVVVERSKFHAFKPWKPGTGADDHPDMIQYWAANSSFGVHDLTIRDNLFLQPDNMRHTQTIYGSMRKAKPGVSATNFTITGNVIVNGHVNAISLHGVKGVLVADNVLLPKGDLPDRPRAVETPAIGLIGVTGARVSGNTYLAANRSGQIRAKADDLRNGNITVTGDNVVLSASSASPLYWRKVADEVLGRQ